MGTRVPLMPTPWQDLALLCKNIYNFHLGLFSYILKIMQVKLHSGHTVFPMQLLAAVVVRCEYLTWTVTEKSAALVQP